MHNSLPSIKEHFKKYGLYAKKSFGQNFLFDQNITDKIAQCAKLEIGDSVVEVGPGPGGLTRSLIKYPLKSLMLIEKDVSFTPLLNDIQQAADVPIFTHFGDVLSFDMSMIPKGFKLVSNLPYSITSPFLIKVIRNIHHIESMTLMLQKEVGERLTALPKTKAYGRLSVIMQTFFKISKCFIVKKDAFYPAPKIDSIVLHFEKKPECQEFHSSIDVMEILTRFLFSQRRKMLRSTLKGRRELLEILESLGVDLTRRAEELSIETIKDFVKEVQRRKLV